MLSAAEIYPASPIKRHRATKAEVEQRRDSLLAIVKAMRPMTVRQVFYQATVRGIVEKSEAGYTKVQTDLVQMRRAGILPYGWLADNTRWQRKPRSFGSIEEALDETAHLYRKALWADADAYVEIWLEKDALSGVVYPITAQFDVPLMISRGYASLSFLYSAADAIGDLTYRFTFITSVTSTRPASMPVRKSRKRCERWRPTPKFTSSESPSIQNKSSPGIYRRGQPRRRTRDRKTSATPPWSLTPSSRTNCGHSCGRRSSNTFRRINSKSSKWLRRASAG